MLELIKTDPDATVLESILWIPGALLYLPVGLIVAILLLEFLDGVQHSNENDRAILALLVLALLATIGAANLGTALAFFVNDWPNFPFRHLVPGYLLGGALFFAWMFKLQAHRKNLQTAQIRAQHRSKHRNAGARVSGGLYRGFLFAAVVLVPVCLHFTVSLSRGPTLASLLGAPAASTVRDTAEARATAPPPADAPAAAMESAVVVAAPEPAPDPAPKAEPMPEPAPDSAPAPELAAAATVTPAAESAAAAADPAPAGAMTPEPSQLESTPTGNRTVDFVSQVVPILESSCYDCHGQSKDKGGLRLHNPTAIRKGGESGDVIVPGEPENSSLYQLTTLPPSDDDIMPSKGDPLTPEQQEILRIWIVEGADLGDGKPFTLAMEEAPPASAENVVSSEIRDPDPALIEALEADGIAVQSRPDDARLLEIDYTRSGKGAGELDLKELFPIAMNVVALDLSKTRINDNDLEPLQQLKNLARLRLDRTNVGDDALAYLRDLVQLEYLNLYATRVTDYGLRNLEDMAKMKELVILNTQCTPKGAESLRAKLPGAEINIGE